MGSSEIALVRKKWGKGSGIWKSVDGGDTWKKLEDGLPKSLMGKIGVTVSRANPKLLYAIIESDEGGLYKSQDGENPGD